MHLLIRQKFGLKIQINQNRLVRQAYKLLTNLLIDCILPIMKCQQIPEQFLCPIARQIMKDPVLVTSKARNSTADMTNKKQRKNKKIQNKILMSLEEKDKQLKGKLAKLQQIQFKIKQQFKAKSLNGKLIKNKNYEGEYLNGKKHGVGKLIKDKQVYFGQFVDNYSQGFGILQREKLDSYKGYFKKGIRQQFGIALWQSGRQYTGQWKKDKMSGYGWEQNTEKVKIYRGTFVQQLYQGEGDIKYHDGVQFTGLFHQDAPKY